MLLKNVESICKISDIVFISYITKKVKYKYSN